MYYLTVGAIFKNEAHIMAEWLNHYLQRGVEKFYLINDNSTDNFMDILQPYIDNDIVALYNPIEPKYDGRQSCLYDRFLLPLLQQRIVQWLIIVDLDEFLYCTQNISLVEELKKYEYIGQITINWANFGSNGHVQQPKNVVESFTKRNWHGHTPGPKNIINSGFCTVSLGIHESHVYGPRVNLSWQSCIDNPLFLVNHYQVQSEEFWRKIKMTRGDADCHHKDTDRDMKMFAELDLNECDDHTLLNQTKAYPRPRNFESNGIYRLELPENTFHRFCKNLPGGSTYGTDGIVQDLLSKLEIPKLAYQGSIDDFQILPCIYNTYKCMIHHKFNLGTTHKFNKIHDTNITYIPFGFKVAACIFSEWENFKISDYHVDDPVLILITLPSSGLDDFLTAVRSFLDKKYTPLAFCKNTLIGLYSLHVNKLDFPKIVGYKNTDYLPLYTNIYLQGDSWRYDSSMEKDMCRRNFYLQFGKMPSVEDSELLETHRKKNRSLLWKPLIPIQN